MCVKNDTRIADVLARCGCYKLLLCISKKAMMRVSKKIPVSDLKMSDLI